MAYTKQTWTDGDTTKPVSAARMQHIEDGLDAVANGGSITYLGASNGTDDTAAIQAILNNGGYIAGKHGESYKISASLVVYSNTKLDMTGCTVTLIDGSNCNMLHNAAWVAGSGRDSNIEIIGGTWARGGSNSGAGQQLHSLLFQRVDQITVRDLTYTSTSGKYAILFYACTDFVATRITFSAFSDGVHVSGACTNGYIGHIWGSTGDDSVALVPWDYAAYVNGDAGDIDNVTVEHVYTTNTALGNTAKAIGGNDGSVRSCRNIIFRHIHGNTSASALYLGGDTGSANCLNGNCIDVHAEHISNDSASGNCIRVYSSGSSGLVDGVSFAHIVPSASKQAIIFDSNGNTLVVGNVVIRDCYFTSTAGGNPVVVGGSSSNSVAHLVFENCYFNQPASLYALSVQGSAVLTTVKFLDCRLKVQTVSAGLIQSIVGGNTLGSVFITNLTVDQGTWGVGDFGHASATDFYIEGVAGAAGSGLMNIRSGCTANLIRATNIKGTKLRTIANAGTLTGMIVSQGTGAPAFDGSVGDLYDRSDGGSGTYRYRCTVAGAAGAATWTGIL